MILRLDNRNPETAQKIHELSISSYKVEASLLGVADFPPLIEKVSDTLNSPSIFFGFHAGKVTGFPDKRVKLSPVGRWDRQKVVALQRYL